MARSDRRRTASTYRRQPWPAWAFTIAVAIAVCAAWPAVATGLSPVHSPYRVQWLILAAGFAVGHLTAIRFEFFGEHQEVTLSELPLLVGLVFVPPGELLLAAALGCAVAVAWSHPPPIKALFNVAIPLVETLVAAVCFHAVLGHAGAISLRGTLAAFVALPAANLVSTVCVQTVIALSVGRFDRTGLKTLVVVLAGVAIVNVAVAIVTVVLLWTKPFAAVPLLGIAVALGFGYRSHSALRRRHRDLQEIYRFAQVLADLTDADEVIHAVLSEAKTRLRGGVAELTLDEPEGTAYYTLRGDGPLIRTIEPQCHPLQEAAASSGVVARRTTRNRDLARALTAGGYRDAVAVPLPSLHQLSGTLVVADRMSDQVSFESGDIDPLKVLANHAEAALHAARLLDWLRQEVADKNHLAFHDTLTDLANRALFNQQVEGTLGRQHGSSLVAVMLMDLDRFKEVNDTLGHQNGDAILQQIALQLTQAVGDHGCVGRLGGDEFAVVTCAENRDELAVVAERIVAAGRAAISVNDIHLEVNASLGIAIAPDHGQERSALLRAADIAMYRAKANGGGAVFYEHQDGDRAPRTFAPGLGLGASRPFGTTTGASHS